MDTYRLPAEWEPQEMIQLTWPHEVTDWEPMLDEITETYVEMAREIAKREDLLIMAPCWCHVGELLEKRLGEAELSRIGIFELPTDDTWARDHGAITLLPTETNAAAKPLLLDFCFNGWGKKFQADYDNLITLKLWAMSEMLMTHEYESHLDFVLEGGSIECNGKGVVMTTSQCLLAPNRNQPLTKEQIEERLKSALRVDRVVWIDHGNLIGDDTDGHIDTIVRFAPGDTLLYIGCEDEDDEQYEDLKRMEQQLKELRTDDGKPFRLVKLPMPEPIWHDGERLPATYANFLILNGAVLVPTYQQPANDELAMRLIGEAFPDREIVGIDSRSIIKQHGSIHCCAMQYPALQTTNDKP